jgi:hypothetical protein
MTSDTIDRIFKIIENTYRQTPGPEFELAYQARIASDRIRFALQATEQSYESDEQLQEVRIQLLDALERLKKADESFQRRSLLRTSRGAEPHGNGLQDALDVSTKERHDGRTGA